MTARALVCHTDPSTDPLEGVQGTPLFDPPGHADPEELFMSDSSLEDCHMYTSKTYATRDDDYDPNLLNPENLERCLNGLQKKPESGRDIGTLERDI